MRNSFSAAAISAALDPDVFFITGDLGFMALEGVRSAYESRFINAGVAEQNMVGVAAGLARDGRKVFVYSIAPFCYARPFEQIRNDICFSKLPVLLVGNGGGYAYGHMGPTHHALEDCAAMLSLGVRVLVPAFDEDIPTMVNTLAGPTYLRLGFDARPKGTDVAAYSPWREILPGENGILIALGPLAGVAWTALLDTPQNQRPAIWAVSELPICVVPSQIEERLQAGEPLYIFEEHVIAGGVGMQLLYTLAISGVTLNRVLHRYALGYPTGTFGSQAFHRAQCGLDAESIRAAVCGSKL